MDGSHSRHLGFGVVARAADAASGLAGLGAELEALGYDEAWANDGRHRSGMTTLAAMAAGSRSIALGVGVAPLDERTPRDIVDELHRVALPPERVMLGVGSGGSRSLQLVRAGVASLRAMLPDVRICVSALGPRMCRLGGEVADVVLLNWATPGRIAWARDRIAEGARLRGRSMPRVACYVRVAVGPDANERLAAEVARYRRRPRSYGRLFAEQHPDEIPGVAAQTSDAVAALLAPYRDALDSCIVRALPVGDAPEDWLAVARAATLRA